MQDYKPTRPHSAVMLPPLRASFPPEQPFTFSDCSELSTTTSHREDLIVQQTALHSSFPIAHPRPTTFPVPIIALVSNKPGSMPASIPASMPAPRLKVSKTQRKIARARTRLSKVDAANSNRRQLPPPKKVRSSKSNIPGESRYWTPSEHKLFVEALLKFGPKDLKSISAYVGTRNMIQCRTHEQKCFMRLMREAQRETMQRNGQDPDALIECGGKKVKPQKDVYSVSSSCGISLLCVVSEEMTRSLQS